MWTHLLEELLLTLGHYLDYETSKTVCRLSRKHRRIFTPFYDEMWYAELYIDLSTDALKKEGGYHRSISFRLLLSDNHVRECVRRYSQTINVEIGPNLYKLNDCTRRRLQHLPILCQMLGKMSNEKRLNRVQVAERWAIGFGNTEMDWQNLEQAKEELGVLVKKRHQWAYNVPWIIGPCEVEESTFGRFVRYLKKALMRHQSLEIFVVEGKEQTKTLTKLVGNDKFTCTGTSRCPVLVLNQFHPPGRSVAKIRITRNHPDDEGPV